MAEPYVLIDFIDFDSNLYFKQFIDSIHEEGDILIPIDSLILNIMCCVSTLLSFAYLCLTG